MSVDWFRSWHGAPSDPKWRTIAKRAGVPTSLVVACVWALMDRASQSNDRGSIIGFDAETMADYLDCDADNVTKIMSALADKAVISDGRFTAWEKHQPKRERDDNSADRVKSHRSEKRQVIEIIDNSYSVTPCNAMKRHVTPREDKSREDKKEKKDISSLRSDIPRAKPASIAIPNDELIGLGIDQNHLENWITIRNKKRAGPITKIVINGVIREAGAAGISVGQAVLICCERGWQSFRADWIKNDSGGRNGAGNYNTGRGQRTQSDRGVDALRQSLDGAISPVRHGGYGAGYDPGRVRSDAGSDHRNPGPVIEAERDDDGWRAA